MGTCDSGSGAGGSSLLGFWLSLGGFGSNEMLRLFPLCPIIPLLCGVGSRGEHESRGGGCRGALKTRRDLS